MRERLKKRTMKTNNYPNPPELFSYHDYRQFLRDWIEYMSFKNDQYSLRELAGHLHLSPSYFSHVLTGKRSPSEKVALDLCVHLKFDKTETEFFLNLIKLSDSNTLEDQRTAYGKMKRTGRYSKNTRHAADHVMHEYLSKWYHVAIRELSNLPDFKSDAEWIQQRLKYKLSASEVRQALRFLLKNQFILVNEAGRPGKGSPNIQCHGEIFSLARAEFHEQTLNLAVQAIYDSPRENRKHLSTTAALTALQFEKVRQVLDQAHEQITEVLNSDTGTAEKEVYQISSIAFSVSVNPSLNKKSHNKTDPVK